MGKKLSWGTTAAVIAFMTVIALASCSPPAAFDPAVYAGSWTGNWNNTTFSTTGSASLTITVNTAAKTVTLDLDLNGNVFGMSNPASVSLSGSYDDAGLTVSQTTSFYGAITIQAKADGTLTATAAPTGLTVSISGTMTGSRIQANYTISGGTSASGTIVLTK
jgi:hypothetical protein